MVLPVPIELIIEQSYKLEVLRQVLPEPDETVILGALVPKDRRIFLNMTHEDLFEDYIGPEGFTLAHELAHWIYDADPPEQLAFDFSFQNEDVLCYWRDTPGLSEDLRIREINANKLAAHILLPEGLIREAYANGELRDIKAAAETWQVSLTTLSIRLQDMGIIADSPASNR